MHPNGKAAKRWKGANENDGIGEGFIGSWDSGQ
jgi:hypothetical protein